MASRRSKPPQPAPIEIKQFTNPAEIDRAIQKLKMRLEKVKNLDPNNTPYNDQEVYNIEGRISDTILDIFGPNSPEYNRHQYFHFDRGLIYMDKPDYETQKDFAAGLPQAATLLDGLIKNLEEKRADFASGATSGVRTAFEGLDLHPRIAAVSAELFRDGHYRNAVLDASVALVNFVKEKSRRHDLDGADLMRTVFSKNNPILAINDLKDQSELDEQEGLMHLFEGAVLALRNPRAHELSPDSPEEALEFIAFLSLLAKQLERASRRKDR